MKKKELQIISEYLLKRQETVAIGESVTAGLVMNHLSLAENATSFFQGGVTAYNLGQKTRHLAVEPIYADQMNSVSERVAQQMALEVSKLFCSHWGIGVTGYAAPVPALNIKSCFAFYAFAYKSDVVSTACLNTKLKGQRNVQEYFARKITSAFAVYLS